jgi:hypothetical protein
MIVVTTELWPGGDRSRARSLGCMAIANNGTSSRGTVGNYTVVIYKAGSIPGTRTRTPWKSFTISGFRRKKFGVWYLLGRILQTSFEISNAWEPTEESHV